MTRTKTRANANMPNNFVSVLDYGADPTGARDSTSQIQEALDSNNPYIVIPEGTYLTTGLTINSGSAVKELVGQGVPIIRLEAASGRVALNINKSQTKVSGIRFESTGSKTDGLLTTGVFSESRAYQCIEDLEVIGFSHTGVRIIQSVYTLLSNLTIQNCGHGLSFERSEVNNFGCTAINVTNTYITGCNRGTWSNGTVNGVMKMCIWEYCGDRDSLDAAFHSSSGGVTLDNCYWEANERNLYLAESGINFISPYKLEGADIAPDIISYVATAFDLRGFTNIGTQAIETRYLRGDSLGDYDLQIGKNLFAPVDGSGVRYGRTTVDEYKGIDLVQNTWTTVVSNLGPFTSAVNGRKCYRYIAYAGQADRNVGLDMGTILDGVLYSDTGTNPDWLRVDGTNLQMLSPYTQYGLYWKVQLATTELGGIDAPLGRSLEVSNTIAMPYEEESN